MTNVRDIQRRRIGIEMTCLPNNLGSVNNFGTHLMQPVFQNVNATNATNGMLLIYNHTTSSFN
jgi:hypothetical protein